MNPDRVSAIRRIVDDLEEETERIAALQELVSPEELLALAEYYNWGDGMQVPTAIMSYPECDLGLALRLFHRAEGIVWFTDSGDGKGREEWAEFCRELSSRVRGGFYPRFRMAFDPKLTGMQRHKALRAGVPEVFVTAVTPSEST